MPFEVHGTAHKQQIKAKTQGQYKQALFVCVWAASSYIFRNGVQGSQACAHAHTGQIWDVKTQAPGPAAITDGGCVNALADVFIMHVVWPQAQVLCTAFWACCGVSYV